MKERVGFSGYSLYEMERLWRNIELFYFSMDSPHAMIQTSHMWFEPKEAEVKRIEAVLVALGVRYQFDQEASRHIIDNCLVLSINRALEPYSISAHPKLHVDWNESHFDLLREIDNAFRKAGIRSVSKPDKWPSFFQKLPEDSWKRPLVKRPLVFFTETQEPFGN